jgi:predicted CXXCH cytochrome family protein
VRHRSSATAISLTARAATAILAAWCASGCDREGDRLRTEPRAAAYVGVAKCGACHADHVQAWQESHHALAMMLVPRGVRGDFERETFTKDGVESRFFRRDGEYFVRTDGPDGKLADFRVSYTFGVEPLQQYLVEFPDGRLQALGVAWDGRPKAQGGQRWFHLYPDEHIDHRDVLHWTGPAQNWNHMCAECHSTNLQKNYDAAADRFATTWTDDNVACEACHGPGSQHITWAEAGAKREGLVFRLDDHSSGKWVLAPGERIARRTQPLTEHREVEMCGRCHSRRAQIWPEYRHGEPLAQTHRVALIDPGLYHADGQILDETYEYGSFLQSRMYAAGVTCSDCHEPHTARLSAPGNALCTQCHQASSFDTPKHHFHAGEGPATQCVSCHMRERLYMVVDGRRDHSFRVPRPDLSVELGTPNACGDCHAERGAKWAAEAIVKWYGPERRDARPFARAFTAAEKGSPEAEALLMATASDATAPAIVRASALARLTPFLSAHSFPVVQEALRHPDALVRRSATEALAAVDPGMRASLAVPLLSDPVRTVRLEALGALLDLPPSQFTGARRQAFDEEVKEYRQIQLANADRADAQTNLGMLEARLGNARAAEEAYTTAIRKQPTFVPARVNLADLYRAQGRDAEGEKVLREAIALAPYSAEAHEALGLTLVRQKRLPEAVNELAHAAQLAPENARYAYVHAIALREAGRLSAAIGVLEQAHQRHPSERALVSALAEFNEQAGNRPAAERWVQKLESLSPHPNPLPEGARE